MRSRQGGVTLQSQTSAVSPVSFARSPVSCALVPNGAYPGWTVRFRAACAAQDPGLARCGRESSNPGLGARWLVLPFLTVTVVRVAGPEIFPVGVMHRGCGEAVRRAGW